MFKNTKTGVVTVNDYEKLSQTPSETILHRTLRTWACILLVEHVRRAQKGVFAQL